MRYDNQDRESSNVEDRRGQGGGMFGGSRGGLQIPIPMGGGARGGFSLTTMLIIGALMLLFGLNPLDLLRGGGPDMSQVPQMPRVDPGARPTSQRNPFEIPGLPSGQRRATADTDEMKKFVARVLADTEDVWSRVFKSFGRTYQDPKLVIFDRATPTACGTGQTAMGPFYCPLDRKVYSDLAFYEELKRRFNAPGDFAQAYVVAHEVGHHVQTLLGIADRVQQMKERVDQRTANRIQVRMELQADCLAGVWAKLNDQLNSRLQQGDIEEGLNAAAQIGDDMIQRNMGSGRVMKDAFTHGSSAARVRWFSQGFKTGNMQSCDTFNASQDQID
jgi:predicted metalloprotease